MSEAERSILGQILLKPSLWFELNLEPRHFIEPEARRTFSAIKKCVADGVEPDLMTVYDYGADAAYASALTNAVGSAANWKYYYDKVITEYRRRRIQTLSHELVDADTVENAVAAAHAGLVDILSEGTGDKIHNRADILHDAIDAIEARYKLGGAIPGIRTGFDTLDNYVLGWQRQRLYLIGARPSQGKSALLLNIADSISIDSKTTVGFISIESSREELMIRTLSSRGSIPSHNLATGMMGKSDFDKLINVADDVFKSKFYIYDVPNQELSKIQAIARQMVEFHGCDILFLDYLQKIRVQSKDERRNRVAQASTALKDLSRQLNIPVIAAAQLRRDVDGREPHLGDFSDSSEIEKDADVAILLHHDQDEEDAVWAIIAKNRDGSTGRIKLRFSKPYVRFEEGVQ